MDQTVIPPPAPDEHAPFYARYVDMVRGADLLEVLARQPERVRALCGRLSEEEAMSRYAPGKWSVKEVVGHMADTERIFSYRLLRVARGDTTPLPQFDENAFVAAADFDRRPLEGVLEELETARASTLALARGVQREAWERRGVASGHPVSARALAYIAAGHVEHHLAILRERYELREG
jgi:uncharacterized damage-inducible protein DinB